jgi:hypothetical protein
MVSFRSWRNGCAPWKGSWRTYAAAGGVFHRSLKGAVTRAALAAGLRSFLEVNFVGTSDHLQPLAAQLSAGLGLAVAAGEPMENRVLDI